ncbi:hypothetical protein F0344_25690 [Streptomyces finlayi]|uniref:HEAT repeat domain-containing protein n=1 Tax=Streptomyces finlayi TaxID=67296 RepID=A0A7G7BQC3_9ACTN|nr:hypothetical protein [Streptomyces finlayi]QNE77538.1 hypothetical protein F0344_25690 [Streptomyces finlayi]
MIETADDFVRLRNSSDPQQCCRAAAEEASVQVWTEVIDRYPEERVGVVQNKTVPLAVLELLIDDPDTRVRFMVTMKRKLSPDLLERLAHDADESIRMRVAQHRNTSRETLESLRHDPWSEVRAAVEDRLGGTGRDLP